MKARIKETGEIVEVHTHDDADFQDRQGRFYWEHQLYFGTLDNYDNEEPNYWEKLKHQYTGMAMNALLLTNNIRNGDLEGMRECNTNAMAIAHALVEKMKEERK